MCKPRRFQWIMLFLCASLASACTTVDGNPPAQRSQANADTITSKIRFNLALVNADGLQGPADGLRALHYEFCTPGQPDAIQAVSAIDPTLEIQHARGRVGCRDGTLLCLGTTHQPGFRAVLDKLAALPFVALIQESHFE